jgi:hypothetical protein
MDNKIYQDDELEQFLQEEVKQHRMYPSDHIWKNIRTELHGYKAWPALTFISLFILTALTISTLLNNHPSVPVAYQPLATILAEKKVEPVTPVKRLVPKADATTETEIDYFQSIDPAQVTAETFAHTVADVPQENIAVRNTRNDDAAVPVKINNDRITASAKTINRKLIANDPEFVPAVYTNVLPSAEMMAEENKQSALAPETKKETATEPAMSKKSDVHSSADEFLKDFNYVTNRPKPRNSKFGVQFYVTPSTSYRRLSDDKVKEVIQPATGISASAVQNIPLSTSTSVDVNNVVRHKPAIGFEAGFAILYNMSGSLKFKTGIQLNVRQYYIETFQSTNDLSSLSLINTRGVETISFYSPYNNNAGFSKTQLDNKIYQISVPLGIQWDVIQGRHFGISTEASVQPTLTLNKNTYLLSTDYKHYTGGNEFIRKWNINTSVGINLTYQSGRASWQVGPQVRYQHLPTFSNLYPIKEYLMDYGIRIGYTRQLNR